jgi:hypothetical protein
LLNEGGVVAGVEESANGRRRNHLFGLNREGAVTWRLPVVAGEGAYLYGQGATPDGGFLSIATDDGKVSGYLISQKKFARTSADPGEQ